MSEVENTLKNSMEAQYNIVQPDPIEKSKNVGVGIRVRQNTYNEIPVQIDSEFGEESDKAVDISVIQSANSDSPKTTITVPSKACMEAVFNIQEPPKKLIAMESDMDSYTRSESPYTTHNYGDKASMSISGNPAKRRDAYIYFHLPLWFLDVKTVDTKLRLYYNVSNIYGDENLMLSTLEKEWGEYGITYANAPKKKATLTNEFTINREERYIEFSVTNIVKQWQSSPEENFGFRLSTDLADTFTFATREGREETRPLLITEYYDSGAKSADRKQANVQIRAVQSSDNEKDVEIEVKTYYGLSDKNVRINIKKRGETYFDYSPLTRIAIKRTEPKVVIASRVEGKSEKDVEISAMQRAVDDTRAHIAVTRKKAKVSLSVEHSTGKDAQIQARLHNDKEVQINVEKNRVVEHDVQIRIPYYRDKDIDAQIQVPYYIDNDKDTIIKVPYYIDNEQGVRINVVQSDTAQKEVEILIPERVEKEAHVVATREKILSKIRVVQTGDSDVPVQILPKVNGYSDKPVQLQPRIDNDKDVQINVVYGGESKKHAAIVVKRQEANVRIGVYFEADDDKYVVIRPSIRDASDKYVTINAKGEIIGYAFIM